MRRAGAARRGLLGQAAIAALLTALVAACSSGSPGSGSQPPSSPSAPANAVHSPSFPECGGVSDQTVAQLTRVSGLVNTRNSVGCQWMTGHGFYGPQFYFTWFRGSPIARERKDDVLMRARVDDIAIDGHNGFIAIDVNPRLGNDMCDVGIQYHDDFFEWSVYFRQKPFPDPCDIAKELSRQTIAAAR